MIRALAVALVICLLGALGYGVQHVLEVRAATAPPAPEAYIQAAWTVYRMAPGHRIHVGEQGLACSECHDSAQGARFDEPGPGKCVECHEEQSAIEHVRTAIDQHGHRSDGGVASATMTDCLTCHTFGPDPTQQPGDCLQCHAQPKGERPAVVIHAQEDCTVCHDVHENRVAPIACRECHAVSTKHGEHAEGSAAQCQDCHHVHAEASSATGTCAACHQSTNAKAKVPASATAGEHTCTGCHAPHAFAAPSEVKPCLTCHAGKQPLAGAGHAECKSCHAPHDVTGSVKRENACASCHQDVGLHHPAPFEPAAACTSCHDPHPQRTSESGPASCTSCHAEIASGEHAAHAADVACTDCHTPHDFTGPLDSRAVCKDCHAPRMKELANGGHARCEQCHEALPHGGLGTELACATCHEQGSIAHQGHQACTNCHDAHTGARAPDACASCHAEQVASLSPKHGACQNCHEPHAATPKPEIAKCIGCHELAQLPALHQVAQHHERCQSCHQAHPEAPPSTPGHCRSCHTEMKDHQPEATQCSGCHPFEAPPAARRKR